MKRIIYFPVKLITVLITSLMFAALIPAYYLYVCIFIAWGMARTAVDDFMIG